MCFVNAGCKLNGSAVLLVVGKIIPEVREGSNKSKSFQFENTFSQVGSCFVFVDSLV